MSARRATVVAALLLARTASAQPADAEHLYTEGQTAYDDKRYDDAIAAWQKSYDLSHLPALVFNLAQAHRLRGDCTVAVETYKKFIQLDPQSPQRADAESRLAEIQPCADRPAPRTKPVTPTKPVPPPVTEVDRGGGKRVAGLAIAGAGVVLVGVGAYFGSQASSLASDVRDACTPHCEWTADLQGKDSDGHRDTVVQYALYGAGAAALITSALLYRAGARERHSVVTIAPRADGGAQLSWSGRF